MLEYNKTLSSALSYAKENKIDREGKAKNCFRNFFNALLLNNGLTQVSVRLSAYSTTGD